MRGPPRSKSVTTYEYLSIIAVFLNVIATYGYLALIFYGIRKLKRTYEKNYGGSQRKHDEAMARHDKAMVDSERRHEETMAESRRREEEGIRRHEETMAKHEESMASLRELIDEQAESRMALRTLIERTG